MLKKLLLTCLLLTTPTFAEPLLATGGSVAAPETVVASPWAPALSGKHLCFVKSAARTDIYLLPSGQFTYRRDSVGMAGSPDGNWSVDGNTLVLQFSKGATRSYQLERCAGNEVDLNGSRFVMLPE